MRPRPSAILGAALLLTVCLPGPCPGHLGTTSYSEILVSGARVFYRLEFAAHIIPGTGPASEGKLSHAAIVAREAAILDWLAADLRLRSGGRDCTPQIVELVGPDTNDDVQIVLEYACPTEVRTLRVEFHPFDRALPDFRNIVSVRTARGSSGFVFSPGEQLLVVGEQPEPGGTASHGFSAFFRLGARHIWTGYDHLLFLLAVLLLGGSLGRLAAIVTAFTVAHSITLSLAVLELVSLPPGPVELAIALSIVWVAAENLLTTRADRRWALTFVFGLIHGLGFASVLEQAGLPAGTVATPLVGFNLGVEAGQLVVVCAVVPLLRLLVRGAAERGVQLVLSWAILTAGLLWAVERAAALAGY